MRPTSCSPSRCWNRSSPQVRSPTSSGARRSAPPSGATRRGTMRAQPTCSCRASGDLITEASSSGRSAHLPWSRSRRMLTRSFRLRGRPWSHGSSARLTQPVCSSGYCSWSAATATRRTTRATSGCSNGCRESKAWSCRGRTTCCHCSNRSVLRRASPASSHVIRSPCTVDGAPNRRRERWLEGAPLTFADYCIGGYRRRDDSGDAQQDRQRSPVEDGVDHLTPATVSRHSALRQFGIALPVYLRLTVVGRQGYLLGAEPRPARP